MPLLLPCGTCRGGDHHLVLVDGLQVGVYDLRNLPGYGERTMLTMFCAALLFTPAASATQKDGGKVAGILIAKKDNWLTVKADGEDEPVKYLVGDNPSKQLVAALKTTFNASRVQLTYKTVGDSRQLVTIKKQVRRASGTVTGLVVKVYDDFWVEVKPRNGVSDAYAPNATNYKNKEFMAKLRGLKTGDSVTITFNTDFERHRILKLRINNKAK
jgi:hypothetical protein